ncbi:MAG TPA: hypothetical protein VK207_00730 [Bacteroidales bacterium]|nr:hypothetical protein [Bacteroidales bacterium]
MKRIRLFLIGVLLVTGSLSGTIYAQEGSDNKQTDKQREEELLKAIADQKKALSDQRRDQEQARKEMEDNMRELEKLRDYDFDFDYGDDENGNNNVRIYRRNRSFSPDNFVMPVIPNPPDAPKVFIGEHMFFGDNEQTSWDFMKSVKESSFKKEYSFDVEKTVKSVAMAISGDCKAGEIRIRVVTPQGKTYSDVVIDEFGNINVRKSFTISETENQDKTGEWKFQINSDKATGYFKISFQTF